MLAASRRFGILVGIVAAILFTVTLARGRDDRSIRRRLRLVSQRRGLGDYGRPVRPLRACSAGQRIIRAGCWSIRIWVSPVPSTR
jgi:hypothetical protein